MADYHVLPVRDLVDHDEGRDCWCAPRLERPCPNCTDGDVVLAGHTTASCWVDECVAGYVPAAVGYIGAVLVIHNAADGRA